MPDVWRNFPFATRISTIKRGQVGVKAEIPRLSSKPLREIWRRVESGEHCISQSAVVCYPLNFGENIQRCWIAADVIKILLKHQVITFLRWYNYDMISVSICSHTNHQILLNRPHLIKNINISMRLGCFGLVLWRINNCGLFNAKSLYVCMKYIWFGLVGFYSVSTIVGY